MKEQQEHQLHQFLMQRQQLTAQLSEIESALEETQGAKTVYKIVGSVMVQSTPSDVKKDLEQKKELIALRLKSIEKQEEQMRHTEE